MACGSASNSITEAPHARATPTACSHSRRPWPAPIAPASRAPHPPAMAAADRLRLQPQILQHRRLPGDDPVKADKPAVGLQDPDLVLGDRPRRDGELGRDTLQELSVIAPVRLGAASQARQLPGLTWPRPTDPPAPPTALVVRD